MIDHYTRSSKNYRSHRARTKVKQLSKHCIGPEMWNKLPDSLKYVQSVTGQNGTGQNGTDKMVRTKWYTDKMVYGQNGMGQTGMDKMVWTKWYGQNGSNFWNRL